MCFCGVEPEISNMWTGKYAGKRWERCVSRTCAYFVWLDEPLTGRALEAVHQLYKEMDRKHYDMKIELWAYYQEKLVAIRTQVVEKVREVETTINEARI